LGSVMVYDGRQPHHAELAQRVPELGRGQKERDRPSGLNGARLIFFWGGRGDLGHLLGKVGRFALGALSVVMHDALYFALLIPAGLPHGWRKCVVANVRQLHQKK